MSEHSSSSSKHSQQSENEPTQMSQDENVPPSAPAATPPSPVATATPPSPVATATPPSPVATATPPSSSGTGTPSPPITLSTPQKTPRKSRKRPASGTPARASPVKRTATIKPKAQASGAAPLSADDSRLVKLRQEGKQWQEISEIFENEGRGKVAKGSLAKRYSRLMVKLAVWEESEVGLLLQAIENVEANKWENVSVKIVELAGGGSKKFTAAMCEHKAKELAVSSVDSVTTAASDKASEEDN